VSLGIPLPVVTIGSKKIGDLVSIDLNTGEKNTHVDLQPSHPIAVRVVVSVFRWLGLYVRVDEAGVTAGPFDLS
jgi:hypothetical protein